MSLKEYHRLADLFSKLNSQENIEDDFTSMPDAEKLKFFWQNCAQEKIDPSSIISITKIKHHKKELKVINYRKMAIIKTLPFSYKSLLLK